MFRSQQVRPLVRSRPSAAARDAALASIFHQITV
jgi:hypothetical protein